MYAFLEGKYIKSSDKSTGSQYLNLQEKETLESLAWYLSVTRAALNYLIKKKYICILQLRGATYSLQENMHQILILCLF